LKSNTAPTPTVRPAAAQAIEAVFDGYSLDEALPHFTQSLRTQDAALAKAMTYGVLRDWRLLGRISHAMMQKPAREGSWLDILLRLGLYQLRSMRLAEHAVLDETVQALAFFRETHAKGLLNACLRRYLREKDALDTHAIGARYPDWLEQMIDQDWGDQAAAVKAASSEAGPMTLRLREGFPAPSQSGQTVAGVPSAYVLDTPCDVWNLAGFGDGAVSVQDASAQLAAPLLLLEDGQRVLDACAAPGGKAAHCLESKAVNLTALDVQEARLARIHDNFKRLKLKGKVLVGNALEPLSWHVGARYDRILIDAPCSGTGVIRRHPDIAWLRRDSDIPRLAATQAALLRALWPLLAPNGVLLYATCSILEAEGEAVFADFVRNTPDAALLPIDEAAWGESAPCGRRIAPSAQFDGFYYGRVRKA
jgi:16S rRNA (cytosine967-C5)-methyltransferase